MEPRRTDTPASGTAATDRVRARYRVETSGRVLLPEVLEERLLPAMREELGGREGHDDGAPTSGLEDLARAVGVRAVRDGDHVLLVTDRDGDTAWTEQSGAFFAVLASYATEGEVRFLGEDGAEWSVRYNAAGAQQQGVNGHDGSTELPPLRTAGTPPSLVPPTTEPAIESATEPTPDPPVDAQVAAPPPEWAAPAWPPTPDLSAFEREEPAPRSPARAFGMAVLFLGGVFLILMIAIVASGLG